MEEDVLPIICAGVLVLMAVVAIVLVILNLKPFTWRKKSEGSSICLTVTAKRNLNKATVKVSVDGEDVVFERRRIRKGQSVDFVYPSTKTLAKLTVEVESGNVQVAEV